jgi:hypothetical protein
MHRQIKIEQSDNTGFDKIFFDKFLQEILNRKYHGSNLGS